MNLKQIQTLKQLLGQSSPTPLVSIVWEQITENTPSKVAELMKKGHVVPDQLSKEPDKCL